MNNDMDYEAKLEQRDLEIALYNVISDYEKKSGCLVTKVSLDRLSPDPLDLSLMYVSTTVVIIRSKDSRIVCLGLFDKNGEPGLPAVTD